MIVTAEQIRATLPPEKPDRPDGVRHQRQVGVTGRRCRKPAHLIEDADWLARTGVPLTDAVRRLDFASPESLRRSLHRADRIDLYEALCANDPSTYKPWRFR